MGALVLLALALPVAGVLLLAVSGTKNQPPTTEPPPEGATAPLQSALEDIAARTLAPGSLRHGPSWVKVETDDLGREKERILRVVAACGGMALPVAPGQENTERVWAQIPQGLSNVFIEACRGGKIPPPPVPGAEEARILIEIVIEEKAP